MYVQPTFDSVEKQYDDELVGDPGPGLARQATEFILSPFYTCSFDDVMDKPTAQQEAVAGGLAPVPIPGPIGPVGPTGLSGPFGQGGSSMPPPPPPDVRRRRTTKSRPPSPDGSQSSRGAGGLPPSQSSGGGGGAPNAGGAKIEAPGLMRTEAEQMQINQTRLDAEMYQLQIQAQQQSQQQQFAQLMGNVMQQTQQAQPHVTYSVYNNTYKPPHLHQQHHFL